MYGCMGIHAPVWVGVCTLWYASSPHHHAHVYVQFSTVSGKAVTVSYPCVMLNTMVARHNTNDQYATLVDPAAKRYEVSSRMTIEFEVDGPYKVRA